MAAQNDRATGAPAHLPALLTDEAMRLAPPEFVRRADEFAAKLSAEQASEAKTKAEAIARMLRQQRGAEETARRATLFACSMMRRIGRELLEEEDRAGKKKGGRPSGEETVTYVTVFGGEPGSARKQAERSKDAARIPDEEWEAQAENPKITPYALATLGRRYRPDYQAKDPAAPPAIRCGWRGPSGQRLDPELHALASAALVQQGPHCVRQSSLRKPDGGRYPPNPVPWPCPGCHAYCLPEWRMVCPSCGHDNTAPWALDALYHQPRFSRTHLEQAYVMAACAVFEARDQHARESGEVPASAAERLDRAAELLEQAQRIVAELVLEERAA